MVVQLHLARFQKLLKVNMAHPNADPQSSEPCLSRDLSTGAHRPLSAVVSMADGVQVVEQVLLLEVLRLWCWTMTLRKEGATPFLVSAV